jgi:hypothetical protein
MRVDYPPPNTATQRSLISCARPTDWLTGIGTELVFLLPEGTARPDDPSELAEDVPRSLVDAATRTVTFEEQPLDTSFELHVFRYAESYALTDFTTADDSRVADSFAVSEAFTFRDLAGEEATETTNIRFDLTVEPNGTPGVIFTLNGSSTEANADNQTLTLDNVSENAGSAEFTVQLRKRPKSPVEIPLTLTTEDPAQLEEWTLSADALTFTPDDWDTAQTVTLTSVDDSVGDGDHAVQLVVEALTTTDPDFLSCYTPQLQTTVLDDEDSSYALDWISALQSSLAGGSAFNATQLDNLTTTTTQALYTNKSAHLTEIDALTALYLQESFPLLGTLLSTDDARFSAQAEVLSALTRELSARSASFETSTQALAQQTVLTLPSSGLSALDWELAMSNAAAAITSPFATLSVSPSEASRLTQSLVTGTLNGALEADTSAAARSSARLADTSLIEATSGSVEGSLTGLATAGLALSTDELQTLIEELASSVASALLTEVASGAQTTAVSALSSALSKGIVALESAGTLASDDKNAVFVSLLSGLASGLEASGLSADEQAPLLSAARTQIGTDAQIFFSDLNATTSTSGLSFAPTVQRMSGLRNDNGSTGVLWTIEVTDDGPFPLVVTLDFSGHTFTQIGSAVELTSADTATTTYQMQFQMTPYSTSDAGDVLVQVTDATAEAGDSYIYPLAENMFPDDVVTE